MNKFTYLLVGGIAGGVLGWLIADYVAYKMDEELVTWEDLPDEREELVGGMDKDLYEMNDDEVPITDYARVRVMDGKESLEKLVRPYQEEHAPYIMTAEEWEETASAFLRITVLFYEMDSVYCTDQEKIIDDSANMFVPNVRLHFGEESGDPDLVYVSNPGRSEMYEIIRMRASYAVDVLGEVPVKSPKEKATSKKRANQTGSSKEQREKKEAEGLGDVD